MVLSRYFAGGYARLKLDIPRQNLETGQLFLIETVSTISDEDVYLISGNHGQADDAFTISVKNYQIEPKAYYFEVGGYAKVVTSFNISPHVQRGDKLLITKVYDPSNSFKCQVLVNPGDNQFMMDMMGQWVVPYIKLPNDSPVSYPRYFAGGYVKLSQRVIHDGEGLDMKKNEMFLIDSAPGDSGFACEILINPGLDALVLDMYTHWIDPYSYYFAPGGYAKVVSTLVGNPAVAKGDVLLVTKVYDSSKMVMNGRYESGFLACQVLVNPGHDEFLMDMQGEWVVPYGEMRRLYLSVVNNSFLVTTEEPKTKVAETGASVITIIILSLSGAGIISIAAIVFVRAYRPKTMIDDIPEKAKAKNEGNC